MKVLEMVNIKIEDDEAAANYGISTNHEKMKNGEIRFRLVSNDGSAYIRTHADSNNRNRKSGWQNAHYHKKVKEIYVVQSGLMIFCSKENGETTYQSLVTGEVIATEPYIPHNVFLQENSIIHTIKCTSGAEPDWYPDPELDAESKALSEEEAMRKVQSEKSIARIDGRFDSYINLYCNLDNIIWQTPTFLAGGVTLLIGLAVGILGNEDGRASAFIWGGALAASSLIMFLGAYGLWRTRIHQNMVGNELRRMEPDGYFHARQRARNEFILPRAPALYVTVFFCLSAAFAITSLGVFIGNAKLYELLRISEEPQVGVSPGQTDASTN